MRRETLQAQQDDFLLIRESRPLCMVASVFTVQGEKRSRDTLADLLMGWGKRDLRIHLLDVWGAFKAPVGVG